jgi:hypothetical protein
MGRTYAKVNGPLSYAAWLDALQAGRSYVSDGKSHLMDFSVNGTEVGTKNSELNLAAPGTVKVSVNAAAYLPEQPNDAIRKLPYDEKPYWDIARARIGDTREVPVEIVVNGKAVARKNLVADGKVRRLDFDVRVGESSWIAARILPAAHTNPIFALVGGKPIRASRRSAEWCLNAVNQCWTQKAPRTAIADLGEARKAYDHAREVYTQLIRESAHE